MKYLERKLYNSMNDCKKTIKNMLIPSYERAENISRYNVGIGGII